MTTVEKIEQGKQEVKSIFGQMVNITVGSPKQIAWAKDIANRYVDRVALDVASSAVPGQRSGLQLQLWLVLTNEAANTAKFWIDEKYQMVTRNIDPRTPGRLSRLVRYQIELPDEFPAQLEKFTEKDQVVAKLAATMGEASGEVFDFGVLTTAPGQWMSRKDAAALLAKQAEESRC